MKFILSKKGYQNLIVNETELPYWILLYDELIDDIDINLHPIWSDSKFCNNAVNINGLSLKYIKVKTYERCINAVKQNGGALEYVPIDLIDYDMCLCAVSQNRFAIRYVPEKYQTEELCLASIKGKYKSGVLYMKEMLSKTDPEYIENGYVLQYIFPSCQTEKVIKYCLEVTPDSCIYVVNCTKNWLEYKNKCKIKLDKDSKYYESLIGFTSMFI